MKGTFYMARHNFVLLYGLVSLPPKIIKDDDTGEYLQAICPLTVIRGKRSVGDDYHNFKFDTPIIVTGDAKISKDIESWKPGDMVEIKGVLVTKNVEKKVLCKSCGKVHVFQGSNQFVRPIYTSVRKRGVPNKQEAIKDLRQNIEISNICTLIGTVCKKPEIYVTESNLHVTQYPIASNRKYKIAEDALDEKTDYPYVKSYGAKADEDYSNLDVGAVIMIDGCLQTRDYSRTLICEDCGAETEWKDNSLEIVPYQTEYFIRNAEDAEDSEFSKKEEYFGYNNENTSNAKSIADSILQ